MGRDNVVIFVSSRAVWKKNFQYPRCPFPKRERGGIEKMFCKKFNYDLFKNKKDL